MLYAPETQRVEVRAGQMNTQGGAEGSAYLAAAYANRLTR
jgi:hypothetical protein